MPLSGDLLVIPAGITVTVTGNHSYSGSTTRVQVYGTLFFSGGGSKLSFPCGSIVEIMTPDAIISGDANANSQTIRICNVTYWSVGADNNASGYQSYPPNATLPVTWLYFRVDGAAGAVQCTWATAMEQDSDHFLVQAGPNGVDFETIGVVVAAGNSHTVREYAFTDPNARTGTWYYRLEQVDIDATSAYSNVIPIDLKLDATVDLVVHPNPSHGSLTVADRLEPRAKAYLLDATGRVVLRASGPALNEGLDVARIANGTYHLIVRSPDGAQRTARWVKSE